MGGLPTQFQTPSRSVPPNLFPVFIFISSPAASPQYDVRAGLEVTGPPRAPQRIGIEPPDVHEIPIRLIANDTELHPSHFVHGGYKSFQKMDDSEGYCWKSYRLIIKTNIGATGRWDDTIPEDLIRAAYDRLAGIRYTALMHKLKKKRVQPVYVIDEAWRRYLRVRESEDFLARSSQATANRNTEVEGPGTGPSKHDGGFVSFVTTQERLTPPTPNELYLHLHTVNHDRMTFIDTRSSGSMLRRRCRELTCATPDQSVDDEAVYLNVAEFNVVAEQLRKVMEFMQQHLGMNMDGAGLSQQQPPPPPAPPPHDQQQLSQIDPVDPPQQGDNVERET
ncbi:hypothetical protein Sjap_007063 [Stephania japonica]|uniref:Uncharacterized protein n=1 Tax=Stephania japonica TaxID=461633 RepID=A0AAP0PMJ1_9MAGN